MSVKGNGKFVIGSPKVAAAAAAKGARAAAAPKVPAVKTAATRTPTKSLSLGGKKPTPGVKLGNH
ncbi:hypothetical protein LGN04_05415 [Burkholderia multivorans]|uniref:Uncharacterized protein n=1 Tax=Burkholderia multivorans TaxID=87883 RepID=A0AAP2HNB3_9BURK|nr:hypothetical protein [Burkholderia multivorans]MBN8173495.1 hypothetical protein [Burkholderia multivorans]MBU9184359.1 hypothetical protein [Burkholderia multivorans]MBU9358901.1 hypothetical protein [Burkholderia multivorans]MBU9532853.1 hypothetical protein [Burkholderia multivorans]MBU9593437.1 hypothetical protein [Burkholderia multivorans]